MCLSGIRFESSLCSYTMLRRTLVKSIILGLVLAVGLSGCSELFVVDTTPPVPPTGIRATALDNAIEISWSHNTEPDLAGYKVWVSDRYDGTYSFLAKTNGNRITDYGARNGKRNYYAVSAYDFSGNESDLSRDVVYATARPEGFGTRISNFRTSPRDAGYDFSTYSIGPYDDKYTDVFFEYSNGRYYLNVWDDTDIQDMGFTSSLYEIIAAPASGWSPSKSVEAISGHTYVIWTWDDHYAKVRVRDVSPLRVIFDWAYQVAAANPDLNKTVPKDGRGPLLRSATVSLGQ